MKVYRKDNSAQGGRIEIFNIMEATYTGKDMGERSITATIDFPSRIDFQPGDYVEFDIANLLRMNGVEGGHEKEKFYIYTMPTVKKIAKSKTSGKAFQHTVTFYPCQYELATVKMRDVVQDTDNSGVLYTGYDEFSFYGGANTLMKRIMAVLNERFGHTGVAGKDYWAYKIADGVNEDLNTALEQFQFDFSDNNIMEALLKLNDAEGVNTKFFINERMIYVGYKRPYITGVDEYNIQRTVPFEFMYGKTSHLPAHTNYGNLFTITKSNGSASPITRLFAKGSDRNLHRFYCSDRIKRGRYVNRLMLPSFSNDGHTDYIDSQEGIARFGIREGSKTFDKIYPSLRFFYYGDLRDVKYCIKIMGSGLESDADDVYDTGTLVSKSSLDAEQLEKLQASYDYAKEQIEEHSADPSTFSFSITMNGEAITMSYAQTGVLLGSGSVRIRKTSTETQNLYHYPIARIQCYRVVENTDPLRDEDGNIIYDGNNNPVPCGLNKLVESAPPVDLAVFCHATGKVVKVVLYADDGQPSQTPGMTRSEERQFEADGKIPTHTEGGTDYIVGSCFAVHDDDFGCGHTHGKYTNGSYDESGSPLTRVDWFINPDTIETTTDDIRDSNKEKYKNEIELHQINYTDDHWITDIYEFTDYDQEVFNRQGYSAYCWPRVNRSYPESKADNIEVNAVVDVGPVYIEDTDINISQGQQQQTFDLYLRDVGFKINEQTWFGDRVFLFDTCKISFLDGNLAGYEFEMPNESDQEKLGSIYVPAITPDGKLNPEFFDMADNPAQAEEAYAKGAFWRLVVKRADTGIDRYWMPNTMVNASAGNHIVFLDIFMPDIYVRVAENRLLKEAQKYLDANDDGDIQYSFDMDQVRPNEQPIFALQMREGAIMRVVDDDLDVGTINEQKTLFDDKNGLVSAKSMIKTTTSVDTDVEIITRDCDYIESKGIDQAVYGVTSGDNPRTYLTFKKSSEDSSYNFDLESGLTIRLYSPAKVQRQEGGGSVVLEWYCWNYKVVPSQIVSDGVNGYRAYIDNLLSLDGHAERIPDSGSKVYVGYSIRKTTLTPNYNESILPVGSQVFCPANNLTDFNANKYYEVVIDAMEPDMVVADTNSQRKMFALVNGLGDAEKFYYPEYTATDITPSGESYKRYRLAFSLPEDFNENQDYYPAILYASDGETEAVHVRLWSIIERDDEALEDLNYVDLGIDTVTINFHDNTRETGVSLQDGTEPERLIGHDTEMIYKITATVKEESRATAWAQLMERVEDAEMVEEQNNALYQSIVEAARKYRVELMNLRNNIFDPDGTCKDTFLQIMMLQVGADSMNYQLRYTHYSITGQRTNCGIRQTTPSAPGGDKFYIGNADERLDHFVFTDAPTYGTWNPDKNLEFPLTKETGATEWPTYFVSLKCSATSSDDCHWKCETTQRKINEESGYYYFNWGILVPDKSGHYTLTETRGNAYMYGDNLIVGKISALARNSYFDLTHGDFVLSEGTEGTPALSYINGVLTIGGISGADSKSSTVYDLLNRLGLIDDPSTGYIANINGRIDGISVGGRNLLRDTAFSKKGESLIGWAFDDGSETECSIKTHADATVADPIAIGTAVIDIKANHYLVVAQTAALGYNKVGDEYTLTARVKADADTVLYFGRANTLNDYDSVELTTAYKDIKLTATVKSVTGANDAMFFIKTDQAAILTVERIKLERGNLASSWTIAPEDADAAIASRDAIVDDAIEYLQGQIDGAIDTWFYSGEPTLQNAPASGWVAIDTETGNNKEKDKHLGDLYYNKDTGYCYRFLLDGSTYKWTRITDDALAEALRLANQAQETADGKMTVFTSQPTVPYQTGDMWVKTVQIPDTQPAVSKTTVFYCIKPKTQQGSFEEGDWVSANAYAEYLANEASYAAGQAQQKANDVEDAVGRVTNDNIISGGTEKATIKKEWQEIAGDNMLGDTNGSYKKALDQATAYGITVDANSAIKTAYRALDDAMWIVIGYNGDTDAWTNEYMHVDTYLKNDDGSTPSYDQTVANYLAKKRSEFSALWRTYYDAEIALLNAVAKVIYDFADGINVTAGNALTNANAANTILTAMKEDGKLTPQEKVEVKRMWGEIQNEYAINQLQGLNKLGATDSHYTAYTDAYTALQKYVEGYTEGGTTYKGILDASVWDTTLDSTTTPAFSANTFSTKFNDYYNANVNLLNAIANKIDATAQDAWDKAVKIASDGIISGGTEKQTLNKEFIEIAGSNRDRTTSATDGSYRKVMTQAILYGIDTTAMVTAFDNLREAMKVILGASGDTINDSNIQNDTYIGADYNGSPRYDIVFYKNIGSLDSLQLEENSKTGTRMLISANRLYEISIGNSTNSGTLSLYERFNNLYVKLGDINLIQGSPINSEFVTIGGGTFFVEADKNVTLTNISLREINKIDRNKFNQLWKAYYDAEIAVLNSISDVINDAANAAIGGENLLFVNNINEGFSSSQDQYELITKEVTYYSVENGTRTHTFIPAGKYVFSAKSISYGIQDQSDSWIVKVYLRAYNSSSTKVAEVELSSTQTIYKFTLSAQCYFKIEAEFTNPQSEQGDNGFVNIQEMQLQEGEKSTAYQDYVKHLTDALHGSTEAVGGLVMTNVLMLKNEDGDVKAGMSGLTNNNENIAMWAGGTYLEALANLVPVLLTKNGIRSKIGCFSVIDASTIEIENADKTEKIKLNTETGITISIKQNGAYVDRIKMSAKAIGLRDIDFINLSTNTYSAPYPEITNGVVKTIKTYHLARKTSNYYAIYNASYLYVKFYAYVNIGNPDISNFRLLFDLYFADYKMASVSYTPGGLTTGVQSPHEIIYGLNMDTDIISASSGVGGRDCLLQMKNITFSTSTYDSVEVHLMEVGFRYLKNGNYEQGNIEIIEQTNGGNALTTIGTNGLTIESGKGGCMQIINNSGNMVFRAAGLPFSASSHGQIYRKSTGELCIN